MLVKSLASLFAILVIVMTLAQSYKNNFQSVQLMHAKQSYDSIIDVVGKVVPSRALAFMERLTNCSSASNPTNFENAIEPQITLSDGSIVYITLMNSAWVGSYLPGSAPPLSVSNPFPNYSSFSSALGPTALARHNTAKTNCQNNQTFNLASSIKDKTYIYFCVMFTSTNDDVFDGMDTKNFPIFAEYTFQFKDMITNNDLNCGTTANPLEYLMNAGHGAEVTYTLYWTKRRNYQATSLSSDKNNYFLNFREIKYLMRDMD